MAAQWELINPTLDDAIQLGDGICVRAIVGTAERKAIRGRRRYKEALAAARDRDGCCTRCGRLDDPRRFTWLEVHHLRPMWAGGDPYDQTNLITVCNECHPILERTSRATIKAEVVLSWLG